MLMPKVIAGIFAQSFQPRHLVYSGEECESESARLEAVLFLSATPEEL